jgi:glycopeptide antibiotics resistance protein
MISNFRIWIGDLGPADAGFAIVLGLAPAVILLRRARRGAPGPELFTTALFGGYLIVMAVVVLCPLPTLPPDVFPGAAEPPRFLISTTLQTRGFLSGGLDNQNLQNLLLTVPFGFGLPFLVHRRRRWLALACAGLPIALEGSQLMVSVIVGWAYRSVDVNDVVANAGGALLGLALFTWLNRLLPLGVPPAHRPTTRTAAAGAGAVIAAALGLWALGPGEIHSYTTACESAPPAGALHPLTGWTAYVDDDWLCVLQPDGATSTPVGSPDILLVTGEGGQVGVLGQAPGQSARVLVTLADGRSTDARLHHVDGLDQWLAYSAQFDTAPTTAADANSATVQYFSADGSPLHP